MKNNTVKKKKPITAYMLWDKIFKTLIFAGGISKDRKQMEVERIYKNHYGVKKVKITLL